jgi:alcohol dehydrogenase class IV
MLPAIVILDPELTLGLPPHVTAATGMDALSHCIEAYCAPDFHPLADGIAAEGVRLVHRFLARAVSDGGDIEARAHMLAAAAMGATAFQKGLGAMHALSHPIGATLGSHHGLTNAVLMPYVLAFNRPAIEDRIGALAAYLGLVPASFDGFLAWILALRRTIGIPHALAALDVGEHDILSLAQLAEEDPSAGGNPIKFGAAEARHILAAALRGDVEAAVPTD